MDIILGHVYHQSVKRVKNLQPPKFKCLLTNETASICQFETAIELYTRKKYDGTTEESKCSKTKRVTSTMTFNNIYEKLLSMRFTYRQHKYQVYDLLLSLAEHSSKSTIW